MIHDLTIGVLDIEMLRNEKRVSVIRPIPRTVVESLILKHRASPDEIRCVQSENEDEYSLVVIRYIPATSLNASKGSVVSSDWEVHQQPERGWGKVIAPSLQEYLHILVHIRERYGYD